MSGDLPRHPVDLLQRLEAAFSGAIQRPRVSLLYKISLVAVAVSTMILPVLYGLVAAAAAWSVVKLDGLIVDSALSGRALLFSLAAVTVGGGVTVLFMFKPLFAPRRARPDLRVLTRDREPVLFNFIDRLCAIVGASSPADIEVDCQVNASAGFRRTALAFPGGGLRLTVGLPLAAGLSARQFAGVLAHEFGHFAQGTGMRLTHVIRSVNLWFARVVYERDEWDDALERSANSRFTSVAGIARVAQGAVWIARRVLWMLMTAGHAIGCFALRQMEYDADAYETQIAGSDAFATTAARLAELNAASELAHRQLSGTWNERRLVDDVPSLIVARLVAFDQATLDDIRDRALSRKTRLLDTHPADADRIAAARRADVHGLFDLDAPAGSLFSDFSEVSRDATRRHYSQMIGPALEHARLQTMADYTARDRADHGAVEALQTVFGQVLAPDRLAAFGMPGAVAPADREAAVTELQSLIGAMRAAATEAQESLARVNAMSDEIADVEQKIGAAAIWAAEGRDELAPQEHLATLQRRLNQLTLDAESAAAPLDRYLAAAGRRVELGFGLSNGRPSQGDQTSTGEVAHRPVLLALETLHRHRGQVGTVRQQTLRLVGALSEYNRNPAGYGAMVNPIMNATRVLANQLLRLRAALDAPYPFEHADDRRSLGAFIVATSPNADDIGQVLGAAQESLQRFAGTHMRLLAHVCGPAVEIERGLTNQAAGG
jgi:Zn-dependent protease with chaperone function